MIGIVASYAAFCAFMLTLIGLNLLRAWLRSRKPLPVATVIEGRYPRFVAWVRCDTGTTWDNRPFCSNWNAIGIDDDVDRLWLVARREYPIGTFDLIVLPNWDTPGEKVCN